MADLTNLESKLGEVMGLAMAAQAATAKVKGLAGDEAELVSMLERMHQEAAETESRCMSIVDTLEGKKTAIQEEAASTKRKGAEMMKIYLDADSDALDGFEFLTMAEAGEVGHWHVLKQMNEGFREIDELCEWAIPIQERHFADVNAATEQLARAEDPAAVAG
jgi:uncharacterized protein YfcZ (UPF0381/DUF406 family)